jgi:single-stranded DNA-specific DHH superfamily exonuclease
LWHIPIIPALGRLRQENFEFEVSLSYVERFCLKNKQIDKKKKKKEKNEKEEKKNLKKSLF